LSISGLVNKSVEKYDQMQWKCENGGMERQWAVASGHWGERQKAESKGQRALNAKG
jgi:hypothetical protein